MSILGLNSKDRKSTRDKANISNPKVNRGCAPRTANRISADCVQISLAPSIPYIPLEVCHTGGFNAVSVAEHYLPADGLVWYGSVCCMNRYLPLCVLHTTYTCRCLNNAGNNNEQHICNGIWSKLPLLLSIIDTTYTSWNSAAFPFSSGVLIAKEKYLLSVFFSNYNFPQG